MTDILNALVQNIQKNFISVWKEKGYILLAVPDFPLVKTIDKLKANEYDALISFWDIDTYKAVKEFGNNDKLYTRQYQVDIFCTNALVRETIKEALNYYYDYLDWIEDICIESFDDCGHTRYDDTNSIYRNTFVLNITYPVNKKEVFVEDEVG